MKKEIKAVVLKIEKAIKNVDKRNNLQAMFFQSDLDILKKECSIFKTKFEVLLDRINEYNNSGFIIERI